MASKSSKWATEDEDQEAAAALAQRKKEKEQRRILKEEKARKVAEQAVPPADAEDTNDRPNKRQRISPEDGEHTAAATASNGETAVDGANILQFPSSPFGPCGHVDQFEQLNNIEEGSYGLVSRARRKRSGTLVALKKLKMEHTTDGFPVTGLREIQTLKASRHANVVQLQEVVMGDSLKE